MAVGVTPYITDKRTLSVNAADGTVKTELKMQEPTVIASVYVPAPTVAGDYVLATTQDVTLDKAADAGSIITDKTVEFLSTESDSKTSIDNQKGTFDDLKVKIKPAQFTFEGKPVSVVTYQNLTANVAHEYGAKFIIRGLRNTTDFEYENSISQVNRHIHNELETVFLITSPHLAPISSTIIRDLHRYGSPVDQYLPYTLD